MDAGERIVTRLRSNMPAIEAYAQTCMRDIAHDMEHVYRVLYYALDIAKHEGGADLELLTAACLLHDISREAQFLDPAADHAVLGGEKAYDWLCAQGFTSAFSDKVRHCIRTHRYRSAEPPESLEAKILFDADKLDVCGAMGVARSLLYGALVSEPLYRLTETGELSDGAQDTESSFLQEYTFKLETLYTRFYTKRGAALATKRKPAAEAFYAAFLAEVRECYAVSGSKPASLGFVSKGSGLRAGRCGG